MEKRWNTLCTCLAVAIYTILIMTFFNLERDFFRKRSSLESKYDNCSFKNTCLSFCEQQITEKFTDEYILRNFPFDDFKRLRDFNNNKTTDFKVVKHSVECKTTQKKRIIDDNTEYRIYNDGEVSYNEKITYLDEYCLQLYEESGKLKVRLEVCTTDHPMVKTLHFLLLVFTAIFLLVPLIVYGYFREIRSTLHGKMCMALLVSQLYIVILLSIRDIEEFFAFSYSIVAALMHFFGAFSSNFIVNLMVFDIYLTFKHFREPHYRSQYFRKCMYFLTIFFVIAFIVVYSTTPKREFRDIFFVSFFVFVMIFLITVLMNIFGFLLSFFYLVVLSRSATESENTRFDVEKERFWLYVKICAIITVTWAVEAQLSMMYMSYESSIIADVIKCFSAGLSAFLLIWTPRVYAIVFERYSAMKNELDV